MDLQQKNHSGYQPSETEPKPKNPPKDPYGKGNVKWCPQCEDHRPTKEFGNKKNNPDGLNNWCKPCTNKKAKEYATRKKTKTAAPTPPPKKTKNRKQAAAEPNNPQQGDRAVAEQEHGAGPAATKNNRLVIPVDLTDLEWIYNELEHVAKRDERTMAAQIRYYLKQISQGNLVWDQPAAAELIHE